MKNRIKWTTLIMSGMLLLGGCGATEENHTTDTVDTTEEISSSTPEAGEELAQESAPVISIDVDTKEWYVEDTTTLLLEVSNSVVSVENDGFDALKASLEESFTSVQKENYEDMLQDAKDDYDFREEADKEFFYGYSSSKTAELARSDSSVVSLRTFHSDYMGGAHGMYAISGETYDVESGELLELADILTDAEGFCSKAIEYISAKLYEEYSDALFPEYKEYVAQTFDEDENADWTLNWYLNAAGIVIAYTPYELGPYAMGAPEVLLPYSEFSDYINEKYVSAPGEVIASVPVNQNISGLIGENENIMVETSTDEWDMLTVKVVSGTSINELGSFGSFYDAYIIKRTDGKSFLMVVCDYMSDDFVTFVYEVTGGTLKKCCELSNAYPGDEYMATDRVGMVTKLDVLGSYAAKIDYMLNEQGQLIQTEDIFTIDTPNTMTIIKELPVTIDGADTVLSVGTQIAVTGTNNVDEVYFKVINSDQTGTIHYTKEEDDSWIHLIDGISEYEYFEQIPYAG